MTLVNLLILLASHINHQQSPTTVFLYTRTWSHNLGNHTRRLTDTTGFTHQSPATVFLQSTLTWSHIDDHTRQLTGTIGADINHQQQSFKGRLRLLNTGFINHIKSYSHLIPGRVPEYGTRCALMWTPFFMYPRHNSTMFHHVISFTTFKACLLLRRFVFLIEASAKRVWHASDWRRSGRPAVSFLPSFAFIERKTFRHESA